jgi:hypothetical protein
MDVVRRFDPGPMWLWVAVNALNVLDAALTNLAITSGAAREANPVIDVIGLNGKVAFVVVASTLVALFRPRALLVPIVALGAVAIYTSLGLVMA